MSTETKHKVISSFVTMAVMLLLLLMLYVLGLYSQVPPPEAKQMILIELTSGGGGGGGSNIPKSARSATSDAPHLITQDTEEAPVLTSNPNSSQSKNDNTEVSEAKPDADPGAAYRPGKGGGSGGGTGTGSGTGAGMGLGSGEGAGAGSGKGIGYGSGNRAYVNIPDVNISENGVVYVEVHVTTQGNVIDARIISTPTHPTNITNAKILEDCLARARSAKYITGKEELRIIVFK